MPLRQNTHCEKFPKFKLLSTVLVINSKIGYKIQCTLIKLMYKRAVVKVPSLGYLKKKSMYCK